MPKAWETNHVQNVASEIKRCLTIGELRQKEHGELDEEGARKHQTNMRLSNKIAAIAKWGFPHTPEANPPPPPPVTEVPGENMEVKKEFFEKLLTNRAKHWHKEDMYLMNILGVRQEYQRLGLGRQLLAPVLKLADKQGMKAYIEASAAGKTLYEKFGWRRIDDLDVDLSNCPGFEKEGVARTVLMIREPGAGGPGL